MYQRLAAQTELWLEQTPIAQISVVSMGGSWGATQAAEFSRMLHERGIRADLAGRESGHAHQSASVTAIYRSSPVVLLLDPVGTTTYNLQFPPPLLSALQ